MSQTEHTPMPWSRRQFLHGLAGGIGCTWLYPQLLAAAAHPERRRSLILLWLDGGPATIDLWDLKPGHANGGPFTEIKTAVPGIAISEHLPLLAAQMSELALIRSMTSKEGDHGRAVFYTRTGYKPVAAIQFPVLGSLAAHALQSEKLNLPAFVSIAPSRVALELGGGFLGPRFSPLKIADQGDTIADLTVPNLLPNQRLEETRQQSRLQLLEELERQNASDSKQPVLEAIREANRSAARLMQPETARLFQLADEPNALRDAYGRNLFGQGCLLARRLIENGVACVEVNLRGWDTHQNNFERVARLANQLDAAFATLLTDLRSRGLLNQTVICCFGEFGRTPRINPNVGRDHWPQVWSAVLAGGIRGGQTIGQSTPDGMAVQDRPITVPDLIATIFEALGLDPNHQNDSNVGRPIRRADPVAVPITDLIRAK